MNHEHHDNPSQPQATDSIQHRARLLTKLNRLISVIEVAIAKVDVSLEAPDADAERLSEIRNNLTYTLDVCDRAKRSLLRRITGSLFPNLDTTGETSHELEEHRHFADLPPISSADIAATDFDALAMQFGRS